MDIKSFNLFTSRWALMWGLALTIYAALKGLTWIHRKAERAPAWQHLAYLFAWPGMDVDSFLRCQPQRVRIPTLSEWLLAFCNFIIGLVLVITASNTSDTLDWVVCGWLGMFGIVFTLHFGAFHILSCIWRRLSIDAKPLMNWPITARGVAEFWGKRWNLAFRDLTHKYIFQPLLHSCGATGALLMGFFVSGIVHDVVLSIPAKGGWGSPTCYFLIQGAGILIERSWLGRRCGLGQKVTGWLFCLTIVLLPCPLLFHPPFVRNVMVPFLQALRGL